MHVEFRLHEATKACAFDPQSFYRMKQVMASRSKAESVRLAENTSFDVKEAFSPQTLKSPYDSTTFDKTALLSLRTSERGEKVSSKGFRPRLQLQLVIEKQIVIESSVFEATLERVQHEKQIKNDWDDSEIVTKRYKTSMREAILVSLPSTAADGVVKVRLLQLPPLLSSSDEVHRVREAIGAAQKPEERHDFPLCIGVAKITLRELMSVKGGVTISLQAKQSTTRLVEEMNLNTVATNSMFGKDDGGSAFFTIQVLSFMFGRVPASTLLLLPVDRRRAEKPLLQIVSPTVGTDHPSGRKASTRKAFPLRPGASGVVDDMQDGHDREDSALSIPDGDIFSTLTSEEVRFDSPSVRFVLIPYMAAIDAIVRFNDIFSWVEPKKTLLMLAIWLLVLAADLLDIALVVWGFCEVVLFLRTSSLFYQISHVDSPTHLPLAANTPTYLYGRQNALLNALVRARTFFIEGLLEECYMELALVIHTVRRKQRQMLLGGVSLFVCMFLISAISILLIFTMICFFLYPIVLRVTTAQKKLTPDCQSVASMLYKAYKLNRPMKVKQVMKVRKAGSRGTGYPGSRIVELRSTNQLNLLRSVVLTNHGSAESRQSEYSRRQPSIVSHTRGNSHYDEFFDSPPAQTDRAVPIPTTLSQLAYAVVTMVVDSGAMSQAALSGTSRATTSRSLVTALVARLRSNAASATRLSSTYSTGGAAGMSTAVDPSRRGATEAERNELFSRQFSDTIALLTIIRHAKMQVFLSQTGGSRLDSSEPMRLDLFARPSWMIEHGDDGTITPHIMAGIHSTLRVVKQPAVERISTSARGMALFGSYLLQGYRPSIFSYGSGSLNCTVVIPLESGSRHLLRRPYLTPCPDTLFSVLNEMWCGAAPGSAAATTEGGMSITSDMVIKIISTYKDMWSTGNKATPALLPASPEAHLGRSGSASHGGTVRTSFTPQAAPYGALGNSVKHFSGTTNDGGLTSPLMGPGRRTSNLNMDSNFVLSRSVSLGAAAQFPEFSFDTVDTGAPPMLGQTLNRLPTNESANKPSVQSPGDTAPPLPRRSMTGKSLTARPSDTQKSGTPMPSLSFS